MCRSSALAPLNFVENLPCAPIVLVHHHDTPWQYAERAFHEAHMTVHLEGFDTLLTQPVQKKGDQHGVIGSNQFLHAVFLSLPRISVHKPPVRHMAPHDPASRRKP